MSLKRIFNDASDAQFQKGGTRTLKIGQNADTVAGDELDVRSGTGGNATAGAAGGAGGLLSILGGAGGAGSAAQAAGAGAPLEIKSGGAGADGGGGGANSGNFTLDVGAKSGSGTDGAITIGATNAESVAIGRSGKNTQITGTLGVTGVATFTAVPVCATAPTAANELANKSYVDSAAAAIDAKASVRAASTGNLVLSGAQTIDGVACVAGDRVLVKNQTAGAENGIYVVAAGAWGRATDADASAEVTTGLSIHVSEGALNADSFWVLTTNDAIILGITALTFARYDVNTAHASRHDPGGADALTTAAPAATGVATASAVGTATSFARSDHAHQSNTAPADVDGAAAAIGTSGEPARADHKHSLPAAVAPADVTKAAAVAGTSTNVARVDHKHDVSTAAASGLTSASTSAEGSATSLARSDHSHAITALTGASAGNVADDNLVGGMPVMHKFVLPAGVTADVTFVLTHKEDIVDVVIIKTTAAGGGAGTWQLCAAAAGASPVTNTFDINIADQAVARMTTLDDATAVFAAGATLYFRRVRTASTDESAIAYVRAVRRA